MLYTLRMVLSITSLCFLPFIVVLNLLTVLLLVFRRFHTIQNVFITNMAISNVLGGLIVCPVHFLLWAPDELVPWHIANSHKFVCITILASGSLVWLGATFSMTLLAGDRFVAIIYPLKYHEVMTVGRARALVVAVWVFLVLVALIPYVWNNHKAEECVFQISLDVYVRWLIFPLFTVSFLSSTAFNIATISKARKFYKEEEKKASIRLPTTDVITANKQHQVNKHRHQVTVMAYLGYIIFFVPFQIAVGLKWKFPYSEIVEALVVVAGSLIYFHFVFSTLAYVMIMRHSRKAMALIVKTPPWRWRSKLSFHRFSVAAISRSTSMWQGQTPARTPTRTPERTPTRTPIAFRSPCDTSQASIDGRETPRVVSFLGAGPQTESSYQTNTTEK